MTDAPTQPIFDRAAEAYDTYLVPAFFDDWAAEVTRRLGPAGDVVVDVGCGTGVLAPHLLGAGWQRVLGVDTSEGMLARAALRAPGAAWVKGDAAALPVDDAQAHAVTSSFALMFIPEPANALREMARIARPGAPIVVSTWGSLHDIPAFRAICDALVQVGGESAADLLRRAFSMGDVDALAALAAEADLPDRRVATHRVDARFPDVQVLGRVYATALGLGDETRAAELTRALGPRVERWTDPGTGEVTFPMTGHMIEGSGRGGA
jgi:ubiquinone/menaquinone biosynthesis C-methylase UbiE